MVKFLKIMLGVYFCLFVIALFFGGILAPIFLGFGLNEYFYLLFIFTIPLDASILGDIGLNGEDCLIGKVLYFCFDED